MIFVKLWHDKLRQNPDEKKHSSVTIEQTKCLWMILMIHFHVTTAPFGSNLASSGKLWTTLTLQYGFDRAFVQTSCSNFFGTAHGSFVGGGQAVKQQHSVSIFCSVLHNWITSDNSIVCSWSLSGTFLHTVGKQTNKRKIILKSFNFNEGSFMLCY